MELLVALYKMWRYLSKLTDAIENAVFNDAIHSAEFIAYIWYIIV